MIVPKPVRVLFIDHSTGLGGAQRGLFYHIKHLDKSKFLPFAVLPDRGHLFGLLDSIGMDLTILEVKWLKKTTSPVALADYLINLRHVASRLKKLISSETIEIIHTNSISAQIQVGFVKGINDIPTIWHVRDIFSKDILTRFLVRYAASHATKIIAISKAVKNNLVMMGVISEKISVIYNGVDLEIFQQVASDVGTKESVLPSRRLRIGMVGSINPNKAQDVFVQAAHQVSRLAYGVDFLIIGGHFPEHSGFYNKLKEQVKALNLEDKILFVKPDDEIEKMISSLDVLVNITRYKEGLGRTLLEAMALGKPVVGTKIGGIPEVIDASCGYLVEADNPGQLREKLLYLIEDENLRKKMGSAGRNRVVKLFDVKDKTKQIERLYEQVLLNR